MPNPDVYLRSLAPASDVLLSESAALSGDVTGTATFVQTATWESTALQAVQSVTSGGRRVTESWELPRRPPPPLIIATGAFAQAPARWLAYMTVLESEDWLLDIQETDEALLALV